jgi:hypothetical protein
MYPKFLRVVFFILLGLIPFQKRFTKLLQPFSDALRCRIDGIPSFFDHKFDLFSLEGATLLFLIAGGIYIAHRTSQGGMPRSLWAAALFMLMALFSIILSEMPGYLLHYYRLLHMMLPLGLFGLLAWGIFGRDVRRPVFQMLILLGTVQAVIAIAQYFTQDSVGLKMLGEPSLSSRHVLPAAFTPSDGTLWIIDRIFGIQRDLTVAVRACGTFPHANVLGGFLTLTLLASYPLLLTERKRWMEVALFLQVFALGLTYSRAAMLAFGAVTVAWLLFMRREGVGRIVVALVIAVGLTALLLGPQMADRGGIVNYNVYAQASDEGRLLGQKNAWELFLLHPWWGVGFDQYRLVFSEMVHNIYAWIGVEMGMIGLGAFLVWVGLLLTSGWRGRKSCETVTLLGMLSAVLIVGMFDFYPLGHVQMWTLFCIIAGLLAAEPIAKLSAPAKTPF